MSDIIKNTKVTLDGSTTFKLGDDTYVWGHIHDIDTNVSTSATHTITYDLKGTNWSLGNLNFYGNSAAVITDHTTGFDSVWIDGITLYNNGPNVVTLGNLGVGTIKGANGSDTVTIGANWADSIMLYRGDDTLTMSGGGMTDMASMGRGNDTVNIDNGWILGIDMSRGNDTVNVSKDGYFDAVELGRDADTITFAAGATGRGFVNGGETVSEDLPGAKDFDTLDFSDFTKALTIDFDDGTARGSGISLLIKNFERAIGGSQGDRIYGSADDDTLDGRGGNDILNGREGGDTLIGGAGSDTFVFNTKLVSSDFDTIKDFSHAADTIDIDNAVFAGLAVGTLATGAFKEISSASSTKGVDSDDRILYDKAHGDLYFDRDGSGTHYDRVKFAHVTAGTALDHTDFHVI